MPKQDATISAVCRARTNGLLITASKITPRPRSASAIRRASSRPAGESGRSASVRIGPPVLTASAWRIKYTCIDMLPHGHATLRLVRWLASLERRFGAWAIPEFPLLIVTANGLTYLLGQSQPAYVHRLILDPAAVRAGEWWRVLTFLFVPPRINPLFLVLWLYLLYQYARALEMNGASFVSAFFISSARSPPF